MPNLAQAFDVLYRIMDKEWRNRLIFRILLRKIQKSVILKIKFDNIRKRVVVMKKLLALCMAFLLTFQLVTPVFAEEIEETQAATEAVEVETEALVTEVPTTEPPTTAAPETAAPEETSAPTEPQPTTEVTEATETTASTEETTTVATEPTEKTTESTLDLLSEDENVIASGTCGAQGDNLTWVLTEDGTLTISGEGEMKDYSNSSVAPWHSKRTKILSVVIENGVVSVGDYAFYNCQKVTSVTLPEEMAYIGKAAFGNCTKLTDIEVPEGITCIESGTFFNCASLENVVLPKSLTSIADELDVYWGGDEDDWHVISAFGECISLRNITIPEGVTYIGGYAFYKCTSLSDILIPESVTQIGYSVFNGCSNLTSVIIPNRVESIGEGAFNGCSSLRSILVDNDNANFTSIDGVLFNKACTALIAYPARKSGTAYQIPEGVTSIGDSAFESCSNLASVTIPKGVTSIGNDAFWGCNGLTSVIIPEGVERLSYGIFKNCSKLKDVMIPDSVVSIDAQAFYGCSSLANLEIPKNVASIEQRAFYGCSNLESITIPNGVISIELETFYDCIGLKSVVIPDSVNSIGALAFYGCKGLTNVRLPDNVTNIRDQAFYGCSALTSIKIPAGVTRISYQAFDGCSGLTSIMIPEGVTSIGWASFADCSNLTSVIIPEGVTSLDKFAFSSCSSLTYVVIPASMVNIGDNAFYYCKQLKKVYYNSSKAEWIKIQIGDDNYELLKANLYCNLTETPSTEIRPVDTATLISGSKLTLTAGAMPDNKKVKANWSLASGDEAYASISSSGVLTAKAVSEVQNITVIATPTDGSPEARKEIQILPKITVKQAEKFNLFYGNGRAKLVITGGQVASARFVEPTDFVLDNNDGQFYIRLAEGASVKPKTKVTLEITLPGCDIPVRQSLTVATTNTAPKLKLNPTASIVNTTLTNSLTAETAILGTEDSLTARSATKGVTASVDNGILSLTLDNGKTTTATVYLKGSDWAKEIRLTYRITVTDKKPTVKLSAKGKLDVLNPASEIVYTPKLSNATGTITDVRLEGQDANLFNAEVVDGLVHLKLAKSGENYATKKTYKVMPVVTLLGKGITAPTLSIKVTQSALKLAKLPNRTVYQSQTAPLMVKLAVTSPASAEIGDVQLNAKTTAALRNTLEKAGGINFEADTVTFPASAFAALKPGRYTVILDVTPANAASDTKPIQARFTLTVRK